MHINLNVPVSTKYSGFIKWLLEHIKQKLVAHQAS